MLFTQSMTTVAFSIVLLIIAVLVAVIARRCHVPYTVGLVIAGIGLALTRVDIGINLTPQFLFDLLLPPLLFEAALNLPWTELRRDKLPISVLVTIGVLVAAASTSCAVHYFLDWPWQTAILFAIIIAATDPVAVIALFKDLRVRGRVRLLVESESLFNDAVVAVLLAITLSWAQSGVVSPSTLMQSAALTIGGGLIVGALFALFVIKLARHTDDHLVETTLTAVAAYGSFVLARALGASGILATITAGILIGNLGALRSDPGSPLSKRARAFVLNFWEFAAFLADSIVFLLIGLRLASVPFASLGWTSLGVVIVIVTVARALTVYPLSALFSASQRAIPQREQHILWWGGLRGALAIALSLSLPQTIAMHNELVVAVFAAVAFSVLVQGTTIPLLLQSRVPPAVLSNSGTYTTPDGVYPVSEACSELQGMAMKVADLLSAADVAIDVRAVSKPGLLRELAGRAAAALRISPDTLITEVLKRDELGSTGIGGGVCIPHARLREVHRPFGVLVRLKQPIDFQAIDGKPVNIVFLLALPASQQLAQLNALASVARKLRDPEVIRKLRDARSAAALYQVITG
jgi:CPA1 family monovalent cation:H+ antiporter